jgi:murein DD-endopeptidase MepM/ murein hydrolase activator NlpD
MRRTFVGVIVAVLLAAVAPARAESLGHARARERQLRAELQAATAALAASEAALAASEERLAGDERAVTQTTARLHAARRALAGQAAALYRSGGLGVADALLDPEGGQVPAKVELVSVLMDRQAETIAEADAAGRAHRFAVRQLAADRAGAQALRDAAQATVDRLADRFQQARQVTARLAAAAARQRAATPKPAAAPARASGGVACPVAQPYSYVDTWGAARSGGRSHLGTDIMAASGTPAYAYAAGTITREHASALGGLTLYLQGADGVEYYYAHLSRYAAPAGARVRAGQLIAYVGDTGNARYTAPHLHFEVHPGGTPVNPYPYVRRVCP